MGKDGALHVKKFFRCIFSIMFRSFKILSNIARTVGCSCRSSKSNLAFSTRAFSTSISSKSVFEPDDINIEPEIKEYDELHINLKGYDFTVLEHYSKYVHNLVKSFELDCDCWPVPAKTTKIHTYKPNSAIIENTYDLATYHRVVSVEDLPAPMAPVLFEFIQQNLPEGVELNVDHPNPEEEEFRYLPDKELDMLHGQLEELAQA